MDVGSIVWYRKPSEAPAAVTRRRGSTVSAVAVGTHDDLWRPWERGKIVASTPGSTPDFMAYTVDELYEVSGVVPNGHR